jgi:hypothetical protein
MYSPTSQVQSGSLPRPEPPPLSLENIKKINPKFKIESPETCSHVVGDTPQSVARDWLRRTAIVWHTLNTGVEFGICLNCQHQFWPDDPDYSKWRKEKSHCYPSSAGKEEPIGPEDVVEYTGPSTLVGDLSIYFPDDDNSHNIIVIHGRKNESI